MATPRVTIDELPEHLAPVDANLLIVQDAGVSKRMSIATLKTLESDVLTDHLSDATGAHAASAISATTSGTGVDGPNVQAQLGQLTTLVVSGVSEALTDHIDDTDGAHTATAISATDSGEGIDGVTVQAQLGQLSEAIASATLTVDDASETVAGIVELATTDEASTGTDTTRAVTPAGLTGRVQSSMIETLWAGNQADFDLIDPKDLATLYVIVA